MDQQLEPTTPTEIAKPAEQRGAIGVAFLVWLLGGGLGLAVLVFVILKAC